MLSTTRLKAINQMHIGLNCINKIKSMFSCGIIEIMEDLKEYLILILLIMTVKVCLNF